MSLKAYEDACIRAELFGQPLPDKEEFLLQHKHLDVTEFVEFVNVKILMKAAENAAMLDDDMKEASGGLAELNTILSSTQTKMNKLKGVCGSVTNFFRKKLTPKDNMSYSSERSYVGQTNYDKDYILPKTAKSGSINEGLGSNASGMTSATASPGKMAPRAGKSQNGGDINSAVDDLKTMQQVEDTSLLSKATASDIGKQVTSQVSKLDQMILQADRAQASLQSQNKQMRSLVG